MSVTPPLHHRAVVLGGSVFIGKAIVEELLAAGYAVSTINRCVTPATFSGQVSRICADRRDSNAYSRVLQKVEADVVVDVTAYAEVHTRVAVDAFRGRIDRYVHISTASVYRWPFPSPVAENWPLVEDDGDDYSLGKADCERCLAATPVSLLPWTILRPPWIYGPDDPIGRELWFQKRILAKQPIPLPHGHTWWYQNLHVRDLAAACRAVLSNPVTIGATFNVAGAPFAMETYLDTAASLLGVRPIIERVSPDAPPERHPYWFVGGSLVLDTRRMEQELGFMPNISLEAGLMSALASKTQP